MVQFEFKGRKGSAMVMPLSSFGQEIGQSQIEKLADELPSYIDKLIYQPLSDDSKIEAIYSPMEVMADEKKQMMRFFIQRYRIEQ